MTNEELIRMAKEGDKEAEMKLYEANEKFCHHVAKRWEKTGLEYDELISLCWMGMVMAFNAFDASKGFKFTTYAGRCMDFQILLEMRRRKKHPKKISSLDFVISNNEDGSELKLEDLVGGNDQNIDSLADYQGMNFILDLFYKSCTPVEKQIIYLRYVEELPQKKIAEIVGLAQSYVSRVEKKAIQKMQKIAKKLGMVG
jgi:RNA polymerase sporulation-specific sigma factor